MKIVIPMPPKPKGRPRVTRDGHAYTPQSTRDYEEAVKWICATAAKSPFSRAVSVDITFYLPIPKSWSKAKIQAANEGYERPTTKPDIDNLCKAILDAANGILYTDDSLVVELSSRKYYGDPRTEIEVNEIW